MEQGNTVAIPRPINEAPGLNAIWVFGENMQAALGLNHQIAIGNNQQICINPVGLAAGLGGPTAASELLSSGLGGNIQLTLGTSVALTAGQAYEINLGPDKVEIHGSRMHHLITFVLCGTLGVLAVLYAMAYGLLTSGLDYVACGTYTTCYQLAMDLCLGFIMEQEMDLKDYYDPIHKQHKEAYAAAHHLEFESDVDEKPGIDPDAASPAGTPKALPQFGLAAGLIIGITEAFMPDIHPSRANSEETDAHKPVQSTS